MIKRSFLAIMLLASVMGLAPFAHAQLGCTPIGYNQTVTGFIDNSVYGFSYCFDGFAGDAITIQMTATSGSLDTYVELFDANGNSLSFNDDDGSSTNSLLQFTLPTTGSYSILATRYDFGAGVSTGSYSLTLSASTLGPGVLDTDGDGFDDSIDACPTTFGGPPDGCPRPDSDGDGFNDSIDLCPATVGVAPDGCPAGGSGPTTCSTILYNSTATGSISNTTTEQPYCFTGNAGDIVEIRMTATSGNLDSFLELYNPAGQFLTDNDDDGVSLNSFISITLPSTGTYIIRAMRLGGVNGSTSGTFNLALSIGGPGSTDTDGDGFPDNIDQCPTQGAGIYGVDPVGCPVNDPVTACSLMVGADCGDNDRDGYPNSFDLCPSDAGGPPNGCPAATTVTVPTSAIGGFQIVCDNGQTISNGVMVTVDMRAGFDYTATAVGINGFDPVLAVVQPNGRAQCNDDDANRAAQYSFTLPSTGRVVSSALSSRVSFTFGQRGQGRGNVQLIVGGFGNTSGEYVLFLEGMVVTEEDGAGDPFALELSSNLLNYPVTPTVYMIDVEGRLDPYITVLDDQFAVFFDPANNQVYCDDGGDPNRCWNSGQPVQGASITTSPRRTLPGDSLDAALVIPTTSPIAGRSLPRINFLMTSFGQQSLGEYILAFHMGTQ